MDDRELLEWAAKAAGIDAEWDDFEVAMCLKGDRTPDNNKFWNPLKSDGDALRLAVKLRIHIEWAFTNPGRPEQVQASPKSLGHCAHILPLDNDPCSAVRLAIVRAAAEMGKLAAEKEPK